MTARSAPPRFGGRRVLVTGASRGIGAAIAEQMAADGADVAITARSAEPSDHHLAGSLAETAERLAAHGGEVGVVVADLTNEVDRARIVPEAVAALGGPIEILVNNAAASMNMALAEFSIKRRRIIFEVNVHTPLDLAQQVIPAMREAGEGWIVNVSSGSARLRDGPPFDSGHQGSTIALYGASKAALNRITGGLAEELHGSGIRVNSVQPRAAVMSEGANELMGDRLRPDQIESMEDMVAGALVLCDCAEDVTGRVTVSLDNIAEWGLR